MEVLETKIKAAAEAYMRERPAERVFSLEVDGEKYWVKRKLGNGRKQLVKYSVEKEFFYEIARMTIAARNCPELVPDMVVLTPDYMVTRDGGLTVKAWLDADISEEEKEILLEKAGASLACLHEKDIVHGRPALRDITWDGERMAFLDWENRMYAKSREEQKAIDFILMLQGIGRENYKEEKGRMAAVLRGYTECGGAAVVQGAKDFLKRHAFIGTVTEKLAPFKMKDVESVRKIYEFLK